MSGLNSRKGSSLTIAWEVMRLHPLACTLSVAVSLLGPVSGPPSPPGTRQIILILDQRPDAEQVWVVLWLGRMLLSTTSIKLKDRSAIVVRQSSVVIGSTSVHHMIVPELIRKMSLLLVRCIEVGGQCMDRKGEMEKGGGEGKLVSHE